LRVAMASGGLNRKRHNGFIVTVFRLFMASMLSNTSMST
jgi:hypothetical protein